MTLPGKHRAPPERDDPRSERKIMLKIGGRTASDYQDGPVVGPGEGSAGCQRCLTLDRSQRIAIGVGYVGFRLALAEVIAWIRDLIT